jgi:uncharacterized protein YjiS (DUF1127 family)
MLVGSLFEALRRYFRYQGLAICIGQLDERMLFDIGCSRGELYAEAWDRAGVSTPR